LNQRHLELITLAFLYKMKDLNKLII
jgi:hypothetical protein